MNICFRSGVQHNREGNETRNKSNTVIRKTPEYKEGSYEIRAGIQNDKDSGYAEECRMQRKCCQGCWIAQSTTLRFDILSVE